MEKPLISIIIPNYNNAAYISKSIDSALKQGLENVEIIVVDDCSTDNSVSIVKTQYSSNQKVILHENKKNMTVGFSRDLGIEKAKGKYIFFLDPDDWLEPNAFTHLVTIAEENKTDITACGVTCVYEDGKKETYHAHELWCNGGINALWYFSEHKIGSICWNKLYRRDFILRNNIKFNSKYISEDVPFTLRAAYLCKKYISISNEYYNYFQRDDSVHHTRQGIIHLRSYINLYKQIQNLLFEFGINKMPDGKKLSRAIIKAHWYDDVFPKLLKYVRSRAQQEWEDECRAACEAELGENAYPLSDYIIYSMSVLNQNDHLMNSYKTQLEQSQDELENIYKSRKWHFAVSVGKFISRILPTGSKRRRIFDSIYH
jgi:glycosyltransferase involved in cell wall biosynthesis